MFELSRKRYNRAVTRNGYMESMGGGITPFPTFSQWQRLNGDVTPGWQERLTPRLLSTSNGRLPEVTVTLGQDDSLTVESNVGPHIVKEILTRAAEEYK